MTVYASAQLPAPRPGYARVQPADHGRKPTGQQHLTKDDQPTRLGGDLVGNTSQSLGRQHTSTSGCRPTLQRLGRLKGQAPATLSTSHPILWRGNGARAP